MKSCQLLLNCTIVSAGRAGSPSSDARSDQSRAYVAIIFAAVVFASYQAHESCMIRYWFDDTDYSVVVKHRGRPPKPWRWEIYRAGKLSPIRKSPLFFRTMAAANKAGKAALKQLLDKLNASDFFQDDER